MNQDLFISIMAGGFMVAFLHAAIPTHWLPFVLTARAQGWSAPKTLAITALAGAGHVGFTGVLGILVVWLGINLDRWTGDIFPWIAGGVLIAFGLFYLLRQANGGGHGHAHAHHDHHYGDHHHHDTPTAADEPPPSISDRAAIIGLLALLTFSPCEGFLPVYLSGIEYGWAGFVLLSAVLAAATLAGMVMFTAHSLAGLAHFKPEALEQYESAILGVLLCLLGVAVIAFEA